jgi:hypothetical protein
MSYELSTKFAEFIIPEKYKGITIPKNQFKMMLFSTENKISNQDIDYWMAIGPKRQSDETFTDYKDRQKFQQAIVKHRPYIYDYSQNETIIGG